MGATYTRQSVYTDGDAIAAADTNDEFDQLLAAFAASTGHTHDGTDAEGGPITKLLGNVLTFGAATAGTDITVTFDGETNDGVLKWMEDEDYFEFSDDILIASTEKIQFRDTAIYINSSADGQLDIVADTEIQIAATTIDINGNVDISGTLTIGGAGISEAELEILDGATVTTAELNILDGVTSTAAELNILDGVTSTAAELNIIDGGTSATSTTVADADRVVLNDNGTMVQVAVTDLAAYFDDEITAMPNLVTTAATTVGALNSGSITSGFGTIDTGSSTITTTGLITGGSLDIDDVVINGSTIGHTNDTDLITVASGVVTVAGELDAVSLDISGDADIDGTLEADAITIAGVTLAETISDTVGAMVTSNTETGVTVTYDDADNTLDFVIGTLNQDTTGNAATATALETARTIHGVSFDGSANIDLSEVISDTVGAMVSSNTETGIAVAYQDADNTIDFTLGTAQTTIESVKNTSLVIGRDDDNLIKFSTDNQIIFEVSGGDNVIFKASGEIEASSLDISGDVDIDGTLETDALSIASTAITATAAELNIMDGVTSTAAELNILDGVTATAAELNYSDTGAAVGTVVASKVVTADANKDVASFRNVTLTGELDAATLDISSNGEIDGTLGIAGGSTNGVAISQGAIAIKNGGAKSYVDFYCESSNAHYTRVEAAAHSAYSGNVTATLPTTTGVLALASEIPTTEQIQDIVGAMVSSNTETNVTVTYQDADGTLDFVVDAELSDVTSLGTLTALDVDDINLNGKVITMTGSSNDTAVFTAGTNGTLSIVTTDASAAAANIQITADGTAELAGTTVTLDSSGGITLDADGGTITFADAGSSLGTITSSGYSGTSATVVVTNSTANTNFPVVFHDESNALLDDTGALRYNPSTGTLLVPNLSVAGTTTTVDTVTMQAANAIVFEGATADAHETTLSIVDPTGDRTINLPNVSGTIPVLAAASNTAITSTPAELNILDGVTSTAAELNVLDGITAVVGELNALDLGSTAVGNAIASKAVILDSNKDYTGMRNLTATGTVTFGSISDGTITATAFVDEDDMSSDSATLIPTQQSVKAYVDANVASGAMTSFQLEDDDGTEVTINNAKELKIIGSGVTTNFTDTSTGSDGDPFDLTITVDAAQTGITSLLATDIKIGEDDQTKIDFETADEIHFYAANAHQIKLVDGALVPATDNDIDLGTSSAEFKDAYFDGTVTADAFAGPINGDLTGTLQTAAQANVTSLGTLTALTVDNVVINGATIGHGDDTDLMTVADGVLTVAGEVSMTTLDIGGTNVTSTAAELNALDGITAVVGELNALDLGSTAVGTAIASKAMILDSNKDYTGVRNFTLSGELDAGSLDISGNADIDGTLETDALSINGTAVTSTAAELNILDGVTSTAAELNILDGVTSTAAELNILDGVTSTAAELNVLDGITAVVGELNALDLGSTAVGTAIASKAMILDSNKDYTGVRNFTLSGELDAGSLDVSGDADIDGTLEADAITVNGTALAEVISDTTGAMFSSNTETGISATYQDGDNTIDLAIAAAQTTITSLLATDIKIGEDDQTKIDFETADEIHFYAANVEQVYLGDNIFGPQSDSDVDLGSNSVRWKDAYVDSATVTGDVAVGDDITVAGRAVGTMTTDNDGSFDLSVSNDFKCTPSGNFTLTFTNGDVGQSGNIILINSGGHTVSAHADIAINADTLTALTTAGTYHLAYFCSADSGTNNTITVAASGALT